MGAAAGDAPELVIPAGAAATEDPYAVGLAGGRVIRGGTLRVAGALTGVLAGAVSAPLVVRHLGVEDYGRYLTVVSVIFVITALTEGGLANVAVRMFSVADAGRRRCSWPTSRACESRSARSARWQRSASAWRSATNAR